jgi:predicted dehydrogenase
MTHDTIRFGIVGAGAISQGYGQAFQGCAEAKAVAVADTRLDAAQSLGEVLGCPAFASHKAMADASELDAVLVCTPPSTHAEICLDFIDRGVHVLCEKPFTVTVAEAETVICTAREKGVRISMASKFRYVEDVIRAKQIVDSGILGEVVLFDNAFTARVDMAKRWNSDPKVSGGGVLIDNGTHSVDIARYFLGPLAEVHVMEGRRSQSLKVEDTVQVFVRSERGVMGTIDLSWSINKELNRYLSVYGTQGTVIVGWKESKYRQSSSPDWVSFGTGYDKVRAFHNQILNFSRSIRGDEILLINGKDALASVRVIDAAYQSLHQNHWISVSNGASATA